MLNNSKAKNREELSLSTWYVLLVQNYDEDCKQYWKKSIKTIPKQHVRSVMIFHKKPEENYHFS